MIGIGIGLPFIKSAGLDPATSAFITATGITDATIINAVNRLVLNYKAQGNLNSSVDFWTPTLSILPIVGGSASAHKFNLKDPRDLDAAYRLTFAGGWTHNANGMTGNGVNTSANTFVNPSVLLSTSANSYGFYNRVNTAKGYDLGAFQAGSPSKDTMLAARYTNGSANFSVLNSNYRSAVNADARGCYIFSKNGATTNNLYKNKTSIISSADASVYANDNFRIGSGGSGYTDSSDHNYAFFFFSTQALSLANAQLLDDIILQFQTDLGRNV
jgi:hypothetical protein